MVSYRHVQPQRKSSHAWEYHWRNLTNCELLVYVQFLIFNSYRQIGPGISNVNIYVFLDRLCVASCTRVTIAFIDRLERCDLRGIAVSDIHGSGLSQLARSNRDSRDQALRVDASAGRDSRFSRSVDSNGDLRRG